MHQLFTTPIAMMFWIWLGVGLAVGIPLGRVILCKESDTGGSAFILVVEAIALIVWGVMWIW